MGERFYPALIVKLAEEDGGGFMATAPDLLGCMSDGETAAEALENLQGAVSEWLDAALARGLAIPEPGSLQARLDADRDASEPDASPDGTVKRVGLS